MDLLYMSDGIEYQDYRRQQSLRFGPKKAGTRARGC